MLCGDDLLHDSVPQSDYQTSVVRLYDNSKQGVWIIFLSADNYSVHEVHI